MSLQSQKTEIATLLLNTNSVALLKQVKAVVQSYNSDLWDEFSDYQKSFITEAKEEIKSGKGISHKEVMKQYKKIVSN